MDTSCAVVRLGCVRLCLVSNVHTHGIMGNGIIITPHDFAYLSLRHYCVQEVRKCLFEVVVYGITSMRNLMSFRPAIFQLLNAYRRTPVVRWSGWVRKG
jgi:hypothetical protein